MKSKEYLLARPIYWVLLALVVLVCTRLPWFSDHFYNVDTPARAVQALVCQQTGAVPKVDVWTSTKPPGLTWLYMVVFAVFGKHLWPLQLLALVLVGLSAIVVFALGNLLFDAWTGAVAVALGALELAEAFRRKLLALAGGASLFFLVSSCLVVTLPLAHSSALRREQKAARQLAEPPEDLALAKLIMIHTDPKDTLAVVGLHAAIYWHADRLPGVRDVWGNLLTGFSTRAPSGRFLLPSKQLMPTTYGTTSRLR